MMTREQIKTAASVPGLDPAIKNTLHMVLGSSNMTFEHIQEDLYKRLNSHAFGMRGKKHIEKVLLVNGLHPIIRDVLKWTLGDGDKNIDEIQKDLHTRFQEPTTYGG